MRWGIGLLTLVVAAASWLGAGSAQSDCIVL